MKLHEIRAKKKTDGEGTKKITIEPVDGMYGDVRIEVKFKYEAESSDRHGDNSSFDEKHPESFDIISAVTVKDVDQLDDDGQEIVKTWPAGTDVQKLPGWSDDDDELILNKLYKKKA